MSFPGISLGTWNADSGMRRIVSRNSSPMEVGESRKKAYRNYLNYGWPASLARAPSEIQPRKTCALRVHQHDSTREGRRQYERPRRRQPSAHQGEAGSGCIYRRLTEGPFDGETNNLQHMFSLSTVESSGQKPK
jgi:hypothetical protein